MAMLTETQFDLIKRYVSHPSGRGYVANFSNQTFSAWFRDTWGVDIDDPGYESDGTSKGNRLISFCRQSDDEIVFRVLSSLRQMARDLDIEKSTTVKMQDVKGFDILLESIRQNILKNPKSDALDEQVFKNVTKRQLLTKAKSNQVSIVLVGATALENLSSFREVVRSDNFGAVETPEIHKKLLSLIDALMEHIEKLLEILPSVSGVNNDTDSDQIVSWTQRYVNSAIPKLQEYFAPERLGTTVTAS